MRVMVPARFKPRKRAGVYFKRDARCRHPVAQKHHCYFTYTSSEKRFGGGKGPTGAR
jgi:hypothetical protein